MYEIKKVLVPVDFSSCSRLALERAVALADQLGAQVTVYHVAETSPVTSGLRLSGEPGGGTVEEYALSSGRRELASFLSAAAERFRTKPEELVEAGRPWEAILKRAKEGGYDLIVMGTHGRTGRALSLAGSVAESVVRMAPCPVLTVREAE